MKELLENASDFIESADEGMKKNKWNVAIANYFLAIANYCDYFIYDKIRVLPKNHNERFDLLKKQFSADYSLILTLFELYRESYTLRLTEKDAQKVQGVAYVFRARTKS